MNDNVNKISCEYADGIVSYLYREMPDSERNVFETHLTQCYSCTDEFAGISVARYSVYEWKKLEFATIATPRIVIPYETANSEARASWFDKLREAVSFAHGRQIAGVGLAAIAVISGVVMFGSEFRNGSDEIAGTANANQAEPVSRVIPPETSSVSSEPVKTAERKPSAPVFAGVPAAERNGSGKPVKISSGSTRNRDAKPSNATVGGDKTNGGRSLSRPMPSLNDFAEEDDKSLRLAEVFEDIETSE